MILSKSRYKSYRSFISMMKLNITSATVLVRLVATSYWWRDYVDVARRVKRLLVYMRFLIQNKWFSILVSLSVQFQVKKSLKDLLTTLHTCTIGLQHTRFRKCKGDKLLLNFEDARNQHMMFWIYKTITNIY